MFILNHSLITNIFDFSYILKVAFDKEGNNGIIYVWIGEKASEEESRLAEEIATTYFNPVSLI